MNVEEVESKISVLNVLFSVLASRRAFEVVDLETFDYVMANLRNELESLSRFRAERSKHRESP